MVVRREWRARVLRSRRHRQLPPGHRADLHRPVVLHLRPVIARDVGRVFNFITGYAEPSSRKWRCRRSICARRFASTSRRRSPTPRRASPPRLDEGQSLVDPEIIDALYKASQAGVQIDLVVRGICCLRPACQPVENIRVSRSSAGSGTAASVFQPGYGSAAFNAIISSADMMPRNLDRRVERCADHQSDRARAGARLDMVANFKDNEQSWRLLPDGSSIASTP